MSRRGGGRGGRRNRGSGDRGSGQGSRQRGYGAERIRFPSDHAGQGDSHPQGWQPVRFPSDSNRSFDHETSQGNVAAPRTKGAGRKTEGKHRAKRPNGSKHLSSRPRQDRGGKRPTANGRQQGKHRSTRNGRAKAAATRMPTDTGRLPDGRIDPFHLFCTFHLGVTPAGLCRPADVSEAARRFDATPEEVLKALEDNDMDDAALTESGYDLELAQMDIQVSPPGVSKMELAKGLFEEYLEARRQVKRSGDTDPSPQAAPEPGAGEEAPQEEPPPQDRADLEETEKAHAAP